MHITQHLKFWLSFARGKYPVRLVSATSAEIERLKYYLKVAEPWILDSSAKPANTISLFTKSAYSYDWYRMISPNDTRKCHVLFGDIQFVPASPSFCKSRPIILDNSRNVLLPFNTVRHLSFETDERSFTSKRDGAVWRGAAYKDLRRRFLKAASQIALIDAADTSLHNRRNLKAAFKSHYLTKAQQLESKLIFALEGNDVASNLKWIMASNSAPIMTKPKFETWFCEAKLIPGVHYILVNDDFSDLEEKVDFHLSNPSLTHEIAKESRNYANQFLDVHRQFALGREVIERYFALTR